MAKDRHPGLEAGATLDLCRHEVSDAPQADVAETVDLLVGHGNRVRLRPGALCHDDNRCVPAAVVSPAHALADLLDVERFLGHQGQGGTARHTGPCRYVAHVTTHDLDHHHPVV